MASEVDICNLALAHLGDEATVSSIDPPEGSAQAEHCARFYPIARDTLLESHAWRFATRREVLAELADEVPGWRFAYALPVDTVQILAVLGPDQSSEEGTQAFDVEMGADGAGVILTNQPEATVRYVAQVTDSIRFSPMFTDALAWLLASYLAGPVLKGDAGAAMARACLQSFMLALSGARVSDANQRHIRPERAPGWIAGR